jgi:hypothetical protein
MGLSGEGNGYTYVSKFNANDKLENQNVRK